MNSSGPVRILVSCKDATGVIAAVTSFIAERGGNIIDLDQHADPDTGIFVMRVEVEQDTLKDDESEFDAAFAPLRERFGLSVTVDWARRPKRVVVFASKEGHCLSDLLWRWQNAELAGEIVGVISNHRDLEAMTGGANVAFHHIPVSKESKHEAERAAMEWLDRWQADLVVLARYMQILSPEFARAWAGRVINIHHSFLPAFAGARPYHRAHERGVKLIGATAHYVTSDLDEGPIIAQHTAPVTHRDSVDALRRIGRDLERLTLADAVRLHLEDRVLTVGARTVVFR